MASHHDIYDVVIVGSGATGGWAAKELTEAGLRVAVIEAGRQLHPQKDFNEHLAPSQIKYRGMSPLVRRTRPVQSKCYACSEYNYKWFVNDLENPYVTPSNKPFNWFRLRILGGRSLAWYRLSWRYSDLDFKAASRDGYGEDWPLSYEELEPYYDKVEEFIGVSGAVERLPQLPDGKFLPPMPMTCGELRLREAAKERFGRTVTIGRQANLTMPHRGRPPCHYCGPCERGCITYSYFSSPTVTLPAAAATGRLTVLTDSVVSRVLTSPQSGNATGVQVIDRLTREVREVQGRVVILCAGALESTRILLNSKTRQHPNGLANSSGALGHYLMDHAAGVGAWGLMPDLHSRPWVGPPRRPNIVYAPRFRNVGGKPAHFLRGYGLQGSSEAHFNFGATGFGKDYMEAVLAGEWTIYLKMYGECLPRWENFCELDKDLVDAWGIPALRISAAFGENEEAMAKDATASAAELIEAAGAKEITLNHQLDIFGNSIHEVGTARMGLDPKKSVLNKYCQTHDVQNLFVMDGSCFVSSPCQNPTLTMMAITCHSCAYLTGEFRRRNL
jgi:choline dehydrogenase-like flavoprotein